MSILRFIIITILSVQLILLGSCGSDEDSGLVMVTSPGDAGGTIPITPVNTCDSSEVSFEGISEVTELTQTSFVLNWEKVDGVAIYLLYKVEDSVPILFRSISKRRDSIKIKNLRPEHEYSYMLRALDESSIVTSVTEVETIMTPSYPLYSNQLALSYNNNQYLELPKSSSFFSSNRSFAISIWFKTSVKQTSEARIVTFHRSNNAGSAVNLALIGEDLSLGFRDIDDTYFTVKHRVNYYDNLWHQVVVTYYGTTFRLYFDSVLVASQRNSFIGFGDFRAHVGSYDGNSRFLDDVTVDELTTWKRAISTRNVEEQYNGGEFFDVRLHSRSHLLSGYYRMGDVAGDSVTILNDLMGVGEAIGTNMGPFIELD